MHYDEIHIKLDEILIFGTDRSRIATVEAIEAQYDQLHPPPPDTILPLSNN